METVALHRHVDDVVKQYDALVSADAAEKQKVEGNIVFPGMEALLKVYTKCLNPKNTIMDTERILDDAGIPILTPEQINLFLQEAINYDSGTEESRQKVEVLDWLIERSYKKGHNNFVLNARASCTPFSLCSIMKASKKRPLEIKVEGSVGRHCGTASEYVHISATSIGEQCAWRAKNSIISASSMGLRCAEEGYRLVITAGSIGAECGKDAKECVFRTHRQKTLEKMMRSVARGRKNRIYLVHSDVSEEEIPEEKWR